MISLLSEKKNENELTLRQRRCGNLIINSGQLIKLISNATVCELIRVVSQPNALWIGCHLTSLRIKRAKATPIE